jgi:putative transposase
VAHFDERTEDIQLPVRPAMSNLLHIVVRTDPDRGATWTPIEVASRSASAHPRTGPYGCPQAWGPADIAEKAADPVWIDAKRRRLRSLSWFRKCIKERLARRANRDNGCTSHFWGEHGSIPRAA